jgi:hypothetical protein
MEKLEFQLTHFCETLHLRVLIKICRHTSIAVTTWNKINFKLIPTWILIADGECSSPFSLSVISSKYSAFHYWKINLSFKLPTTSWTCSINAEKPVGVLLPQAAFKTMPWKRISLTCGSNISWNVILKQMRDELKGSDVVYTEANTLVWF